MTSRRAARGRPSSASSPQGLPPHLASGPCIEDWAAQARPPWSSSQWPAFKARRAWTGAVHAWAVSSGWATGRRPADNACSLARIRIPWSREFLLARGEHEYVDWLEGRRDEHPGRPGAGWQPLQGSIA